MARLRDALAQANNGCPYQYGIKVGDEWVDRQCGWNDHGTRCQREGWMSQGGNGHGPWYCSDDFWKLLGHGAKAEIAQEQHAEWVQDVRALIKAKRVA